MSSLDDARQFKHRDAASYDPVVDSFDRFTERYTVALVRSVLNLANLGGGERVLDIGTGTGVVARAAAREVGAEGRVVGIDLSEGMLARANEKAKTEGLAERLEFRRMDAENLELADGSFDAVVSLYALLHLPNPERAIAEMHRVLRPGGRLVIAVGSGPSRFSREGIEDGVKRVKALVQMRRGLRLEAPAYLVGLVNRHLPHAREQEESALASTHHNRAVVVPRLVAAAGFERVECAWRGYEPVVDSPEDFWDLQSTFSSVARKRLSDAPLDKGRALREEFFSTCGRVLARGGRLVYPYAALFVAANRPAD